MLLVVHERAEIRAVSELGRFELAPAPIVRIGQRAAAVLSALARLRAAWRAVPDRVQSATSSRRAWRHRRDAREVPDVATQGS